jgi:hypothetical protein
LLRKIPVTSADLENSSAWRRAFWPLVASRTSNVSCGAPAGRAGLSAAAARQLVMRPQGSRAREWARLLSGLGLRVAAVLALCFLVVYHFNLVELVAETLRNGPDAE